MKIKFGSIIVAGSGKIGGHVASKNRGGAYLRTKVTPTNPNTSYQAEVRSRFSSLSSDYSALSVANRQSFVDGVKDFASTDIFGDIKNPSGLNLYVKLNANLLASGQSGLNVCPVKAPVGFEPIQSVVFDVSQASSSVITLENTSTENVIYKIEATAPVSAGTAYVKNLYRTIGYDTAVNGTLAYGSIYTNKFGNLAVGQVMFVQITPIIATGQAGIPISARVVAVA